MRSFIGGKRAHVAIGALVFSLAALGCGAPGPEATPPIHTPRWAFRPWISKDISTTDDSYDFVAGFRDREIPVGVLVLDSPWETDYHTFVPNPVRYHDFGRLVSDLRGEDIRLVLWMTQMENASSYDLEPGGDAYTTPNALWKEFRDEKYFVDDGADYGWWKGDGGAVDFFDDAAMKRWHELQDPMLDAGIGGWKLDFGDEYVSSDPVKTKQGLVTHQAYSEAYYRDFYAYGVDRRGAEEITTLVRPYDKSYQFAGRFYARPEHAPVCWVGDNRRDWVGLADALDEMFRSANAGYVVLGSDIGGYLDSDDQNLLTGIPFDAEVFLRWLAVGAMTPFMELHGRANLEPWALPARSDEAVASYRYWASLHEALVPYFYSLAEEAYAQKRGSIMTPIGDEASWPGDYRYLLGDAFFVAPFLDGTGSRSVTLPDGARWYDWWDDAAVALDGGTTVARSYVGDPRKIPLFVREGSIIPLDGNPAGGGLVDPVAGAIGLPSSGGALVLLVTPGPTAAHFTLHDVEGTVQLDATGGQEITVTAAGSKRALLVRVRQAAAPTSVLAGDTALANVASRDALSTSEGWWRDPAAPYTWVRAAANPAGVTITLH